MPSPYQSPIGFSIVLADVAESAEVFAFLPDRHFSNALLAILRGAVELVYERRSQPARALEIHYLNEECLIRGDTAGASQFYLLRYAEAYGKDSVYGVSADTAFPLLTGEGYPVIADYATFSLLEKLLQLLQKHQDGTASQSSTVICGLAFSLFFSCVAELQHFSSPGGQKRLRRKELVALRFYRLVEQYASIRHDVHFYAQELYMTQGNLAKIIREVTGNTPKAWIEKVLVATAKKSLDTTDWTVYSIAEATGFTSSSAFNNFFKAHTGLTPNEYRNRKT